MLFLRQSSLALVVVSDGLTFTAPFLAKQDGNAIVVQVWICSDNAGVPLLAIEDESICD